MTADPESNRLFAVSHSRGTKLAMMERKSRTARDKIKQRKLPYKIMSCAGATFALQNGGFVSRNGQLSSIMGSITVRKGPITVRNNFQSFFTAASTALTWFHYLNCKIAT